jgi:hypothetical protein
MSLVFEAQLPDVLIQDGDRTVTAPVQKLVLLALADHASDEGEGAYPSLTRLERKTALGRQSVVNALTALKRAGLIIRNGISKRGTVNYTLDLTALQALVHQVDSRASASPPGGLARVHQVDSPSPPGGLESSLNRPLTIIESVRSEKNNGRDDKLLHWLRIAGENLLIDRRKYAAFEERITGLDLDGATIVVHGMGDQAGYYQQRWAKTMSNTLVGVLNQPDAAVRFAAD